MTELGVRSTARWWEMAFERGRAALERRSRAYVRMAHRRTPTRIGVDDNTDVLIEGFPRSGNSFLVSWVGRANPGLRIASHMHSIAHVREALRRDLPVVVVIRQPEAALASLAVYNPRISLDRQIERYRRFHQGVIDLVDEVLISPFPITTESPDRVVDALQATMTRDLKLVPDGGLAEVKTEVDRRSIVFGAGHDERRVARPSDARRGATARAREQLRSEHAGEIARLDALHDELANSPSAITRAPAGAPPSPGTHGTAGVR